ncbi:WD40/YVTN/BNR-like repeat-containing protein [Cohnella zeiphila]|uniref:Photosynthesis system II assembly factor Ycf48/Hcf136-like domain-containing protein n=1 Tax=Cohnella zeiphila TaxID=2761120 RepID=A0A7X0VTR0_9BACL|nr:hypothetical protein [Cohnella zeiphila]MBB6730206.1 hypothetical protein [Cohnella zeiphila]
MLKKKGLGAGALLMTLALAFTISGCQSSGGTASGNSGSSPGSSQTASASPSSDPSASPSSSTADDSNSAAPTDSSSGGDTASSAPQTTPVSSEAPKAYMGQVTALRLADDKIGWVGGKGWIARTDDGGARWTVQYSQGSDEIHQLFALNSQKVWATVVGGSGSGVTLIRSTDGGAHWSKVGTVPNDGFLHFTSDTTAFSGNAMTTDGGKTWTKLSVPSHAVGDVYFHDKANGWAVQKGDGKFYFLHTSDAGKTWKNVFTRTNTAELNGAVIRSTGKDDAWIELIGGSGMSQTSYSLFHTADGGKSWLPSAWRNGAGSGPAPGFKMDDESVPDDSSAGPGDLYVVNPQTAFMGRQCSACDQPNSVMETTDGGKSWAVRKDEFGGYGTQFVAATDAKHVWLITTENEASPVLYTSADGGVQWKKVHAFEKAKPE